MSPKNAKKASVYLGEPLIRALDGFGEERSARINTIADRYIRLVERETPEFSRNEWLAIVDALNGGGIENIDWIGFSIGESALELDAKWGVDCGRIASRIRDLPFPAKVALAEIVDRFWRPSVATHATYDEMLRAIGAKIA